ncbi:MAG: RNA-directed DNA polymerase [Lachnospiraceae bacterium]|nr:RNA-directed DNA polymerase [Lachnospiraceae bacterium]
MSRTDLWQYCTWEHCEEMLLSFHLLGENDWPKNQVIACLYALSNHPEQHYEKIRIPKRTGGFRTLLVPDPLLKYVQRNLLHHVLDGFSISDHATAYRKKGIDSFAVCGVVENAAMHKKRRLIMKLDIKDFFGNITFPMVLHHAFPVKYFPPEIGNLLASICCYQEYLPQGAPTSPAISNLVMKPFDTYMTEWCNNMRITYSRYCDDITFSGDFAPGTVLRKSEDFLGAMGFELNKRKTRVLSRSSRQIVTGLVVNEKVQPSREYRKKLRQEIYYCRKYGVEEHLRYMGKEREFLLPDGNFNRLRYLQILQGKIRYVRLTRPGDPWFKKAEEWIKEEGGK